jgi:hypothetical protein
MPRAQIEVRSSSIGAPSIYHLSFIILHLSFIRSSKMQPMTNDKCKMTNDK